MQVQNIQSTNFQAKQRFVTSKTKDSITELLKLMNEKTIYSSNGYTFSSAVYNAISDSKQKIKFQDGRIYLGDKLKQKNLQGKVLITVGKTEMAIDNKTGEILDYHKPFYTSWKNVLSKVGTALEFFRQNFNNKELVQQRVLRIQGFTEQGLNKLMNSR